jgi:hypothetical protein
MSTARFGEKLREEKSGKEKKGFYCRTAASISCRINVFEEACKTSLANFKLCGLPTTPAISAAASFREAQNNRPSDTLYDPAVGADQLRNQCYFLVANTFAA